LNTLCGFAFPAVFSYDVVRPPAAADHRGPLVVIQSVDGPTLIEKLGARGIIASCRDHGLRVAFHAYNSDADIDAVLSALRAESPLLERSACRLEQFPY
jgi:selenocysteine lyase/cysteine desulfurase